MKNERKPVNGWKRSVVLNRQEWLCGCCKTPILDPRECEIDHVLAFKHGGGNGFNNLSALCVECHKEKTRLDMSMKGVALKYRKLRVIKSTWLMLNGKRRDLAILLRRFTPEYAYSYKSRQAEYFRIKRWLDKNKKAAFNHKSVRPMTFSELITHSKIKTKKAQNEWFLNWLAENGGDITTTQMELA